MDLAGVWQAISADFPIYHAPEYEMLTLSLNSRPRVCVVPIAVLNTGADVPLLRFAVPGGSIPPARIQARSGPLTKNGSKWMWSMLLLQCSRRSVWVYLRTSV